MRPDGEANGNSSGNKGRSISCRRFSRYSASSSGEAMLTASKSRRFALFSATMRCNTLAEDARHTLTRTP